MLKPIDKSAIGGERVCRVATRVNAERTSLRFKHQCSSLPCTLALIQKKIIENPKRKVPDAFSIENGNYQA